MDGDRVFRSSLVTLGAVVLLVGLFTFSFKKMMATYICGLLGIAGLLLPDWEFFDRDFSEWFSPMTTQRAPRNDGVPQIGRFKCYPLRVALLAVIYSFGLFKWWRIVSS